MILVRPTGLGGFFFLNYWFAQRVVEVGMGTGLPNGSGGYSFFLKVLVWPNGSGGILFFKYWLAQRVEGVCLVLVCPNRWGAQRVGTSLLKRAWGVWGVVLVRPDTLRQVRQTQNGPIWPFFGMKAFPETSETSETKAKPAIFYLFSTMKRQVVFYQSQRDPPETSETSETSETNAKPAILAVFLHETLCWDD